MDLVDELPIVIDGMWLCDLSYRLKRVRLNQKDNAGLTMMGGGKWAKNENPPSKTQLS